MSESWVNGNVAAVEHGVANYWLNQVWISEREQTSIHINTKNKNRKWWKAKKTERKQNKQHKIQTVTVWRKPHSSDILLPAALTASKRAETGEQMRSGRTDKAQ